MRLCQTRRRPRLIILNQRRRLPEREPPACVPEGFRVGYFCASSRRTYCARSKADGSAACFWLSFPLNSAMLA